MATLKDLYGNTHVSKIHNKKAPAGCWVELLRNVDKQVVEFVTHYPNGKTVSEKNDYKSKFVANDDGEWSEYAPDENVKNAVAEEAARDGAFSSTNRTGVDLPASSNNNVEKTDRSNEKKEDSGGNPGIQVSKTPAHKDTLAPQNAKK